MIHRFIIDVICVYLCIVPSLGKYSIKPDLFFLYFDLNITSFWLNYSEV